MTEADGWLDPWLETVRERSADSPVLELGCYFEWNETVGIVHRIRNVLVDGGLLICRLNSTRDDNYGASGYPRIEDHFYNVHGRPKRFFDEADVLRLFAGWKSLLREERTIERYERPKIVWEVVVETRGVT